MLIAKFEPVLPGLFRQFICLNVCCLALVVFACDGWTQPLINDGPTEQPKKKLTPEERAFRKRQKEEMDRDSKVERTRQFGTLPPNDDSPLAIEYQNAFNRFRDALVQVDQVQYRQQLAVEFTPKLYDELMNDWLDSLAQGNEALAQWLAKAGEIYASDPEKYKSIGDSLVEMMMMDGERDRFDPWLGPAKALFHANRLNSSNELLSMAGLIGFANNDFDFAEQCWIPVRDAGNLPNEALATMQQIPMLKQKWERELELRKKDAEKDNNPRVELITTKGRIVVELFEDAAPEAVKSFIYLVENKYYTRLPFFRVEKHFCVQTGCEKGDGSGNAGYTIFGEASLPSHRDHFRGSLAVALGSNPETKTPVVDSGGAQFYITYLPVPTLDEKYTVFGRVVEGMPCMSLFRVMNLSDAEERKDTSNRPDLLMSAKVLRKRDHEYRPQTATGKLRR